MKAISWNACSDHRGHDAALAVSNDADAASVHLGQALKKAHPGLGARREVQGGGRVEVTGRLAHAAIVHAQGREPTACQLVREQLEHLCL